MTKELRRRAWTTPGPDPTHVVEWRIELPHGTIKLTEFQNVYWGEQRYKQHGDRESTTARLPEDTAKALHVALENEYEARNIAVDMGDGLDDQAREAERKAGWDPNP